VVNEGDVEIVIEKNNSRVQPFKLFEQVFMVHLEVIPSKKVPYFRRILSIT
jgi:hypothetical protein